MSARSIEARTAGHRIELVDLAAQQRRIRAGIDAAIARVLDHGKYIMGPEVAALERQLADFCGARHAIGCASGTDALLIAMMAKGVGPGDAVVCPAFTYTATAETVALIGATPVLVDVDGDTFNIGPGHLRAGVATARRLGLRPAAAIAVDLFGLPADYEGLSEVARAEGVWLLADAAQSFGAHVATGARVSKVGTRGHITATSFFPAKPLGCYGDGGAIFTDDDTLADAMRSIRSHGSTPHGKYDIARVGLNGRLDTLQAAILIEKLKIFPEELAARQRVAARYSESLRNVVVTPTVPAGATSAWAQYTVIVPGGARDRLAEELKAAGIPTAVYYPRPLHHQAAYRHYPTAGALDRSERLCREVLSLPMHPYLDAATQDRIAEAVRRGMGAGAVVAGCSP
jgi:UDP-2-acetamido-2-deoxy-ribo-hexuluronate aminotransferase